VIPIASEDQELIKQKENSNSLVKHMRREKMLVDRLVILITPKDHPLQCSIQRHLWMVKGPTIAMDPLHRAIAEVNLINLLDPSIPSRLGPWTTGCPVFELDLLLSLALEGVGGR
jgi:hypothetical protein